MIKLNIDQGSEAWHEARTGRVTSTRFAALIMDATTVGYKNLVKDIVCEIITGKQEEGFSNKLMEEAKEMEPVARAAFEQIMEVDVSEVGFIIPDEDNRFHEWIGDSPDGAFDNSCLEIKCPLARTHLDYITANKLPSEYRAQVQAHLFVGGFEKCYFMSYVEGMKPFIITVYPDDETHRLFELRLDMLILEVQSKLDKYNQYDPMI
ncbi:MAG TPA: hypothetical protein DDW27_08490 [Bacteroidales bacterium]|nr:hypothetical protein [Bacteroidales bacterium]